MLGEELSEKQRAKIDELRSRMAGELKKMPDEYGEDMTLLRWLVGWDFDVGECVCRSIFAFILL